MNLTVTNGGSIIIGHYYNLTARGTIHINGDESEHKQGPKIGCNTLGVIKEAETSCLCTPYTTRVGHQ